ncbi:MAG: ParB/RepB/Spo0J family partition protein [Myxococcota bacterium]
MAAPGPKRQALGKGLGALIPQKKPESHDSIPRTGVVEVSIEDVKPNQSQPRKSFDDDALDELAESVRQHGLMQPILVRKQGAIFEIIAGERRWRACQRAGLKRVDVVVKDLTDDASFEWALIENIQREDLNPIEEAEAFRRLLDSGGLTQEQLAIKLSKDRSTIANALRLLKLPDEVRRQVVSGALSMGHARALLALESEDAMVRMGREAVSKGLSVREVEKRVRGTKSAKVSGTTDFDPFEALPGGAAAVKRTQESLRRTLGTKVRITANGRRGKIEIDFASPDELNRLIEFLMEH